MKKVAPNNLVVGDIIICAYTIGACATYSYTTGKESKRLITTVRPFDKKLVNNEWHHAVCVVLRNMRFVHHDYYVNGAFETVALLTLSGFGDAEIQFHPSQQECLFDVV